jgi:hypothetical protein
MNFVHWWHAILSSLLVWIVTPAPGAGAGESKPK